MTRNTSRTDDRRRRRSRRELLKACEALIEEVGYEATTADAIAAQADMGRRTFYNHFDNKRDCVLAAVTDRYQGYVEDVFSHRGEEQDAAIAMVRTAITVLDRILDDPLTGRLLDSPRLLAQAIDHSQRNFMLDDIQRGRSQGAFSVPSNLGNLPTIMLWGFVGLILETSGQSNREQARTDWGRHLLLNLGVPLTAINDILRRALS